MKQNLNFQWSFLEGYSPLYLKEFPIGAIKVDLPHTVKEVPLNYFSEASYQGLYCYEKFFDMENDLPVNFLVFEGAMLKIHVYLNGEDLGEHVSGFMPVKLDISKCLKKKKNRLLVVLDSREDPNVPPFGKVVDYLTFGGIYRPVYIESHAESYLKDILIEANSDGTLRLKPEIVGKEKPHYALYDAYHLVENFDEDEHKVASPITPWDNSDKPKLYRLLVTVGKETSEFLVGFRDVEWKKDGFYLNGKPLKLRGLNRHQTFAYVGAALPASAQREDARILKKELGCNVVRTSHYGDDESFLDECDKLGLLVINEVPGWQYVGKNKEWRDNFFDLTKRLVLKERNHPSLIAYGLRIDESEDDEELNKGANKIQKELDPTRKSLGVRNFKESKCYDDIYAYNDFSCSSVEHGLDEPSSWKGAIGLPKLVTEHNGHMFPTKSFDPTDRRLEHALRHLRVMDDAYKYDDLCGAIGWCAFDYNTHKEFGSDDHICYHGVSSIHRNPKLAGYAYASQGERNVFQVSHLLQVGDVDECLLSNVYCFTNADYVDFYLGNEKIGRFYPDKEEFPHLPHPPIKIDDFIGDRFNEKLSPKDAERIKKALNLAATKGFSRMSTKEKFPVALVALKNHLSFNAFVAMYNKYIQNWGQRSAVYEFVAYRGGEEMARKKIGASTEFHYELRSMHEHLKNEETYDVSRIKIFKVDEYGTQMPYTSDVLTFETEGPIEVIGPKSVALQGGEHAVYVRSLPTSKESVATLTVKGVSGIAKIKLVVE